MESVHHLMHQRLQTTLHRCSVTTPEQNPRIEHDAALASFAEEAVCVAVGEAEDGEGVGSGDAEEVLVGVGVCPAHADVVVEFARKKYEVEIVEGFDGEVGTDGLVV